MRKFGKMLIIVMSDIFSFIENDFIRLFTAKNALVWTGHWFSMWDSTGWIQLSRNYFDSVCLYRAYMSLHTDSISNNYKCGKFRNVLVFMYIYLSKCASLGEVQPLETYNYDGYSSCNTGLGGRMFLLIKLYILINFKKKVPKLRFWSMAI